MGGSVSLPRRRADRLDLGRAGCNFLTSTVGLTLPSPVIRTPHPNPPPQGWRASESCPRPRDCRGLLATRTETSAPTREQLRVERGHPSHRVERGHRGQEEPGTTEAPR